MRELVPGATDAPVEKAGEMTKQQRTDEIRELKKGVSFLKSDLIKTSHKIRALSAKEANKLDRIIYRLEMWQNK
jgi:hypothetical protein